MSFKPFSQWKTFFVSSTIIAVCAFFSYVLIGLIAFPSELLLMEGQENSLRFQFPFSADYHTDSVAVLSNSVGAIEDNIVIDNDEAMALGGEDNLDFELSFFGFPVKEVSVAVIPETKVVPCGMTVGVKIFTDGVMVLGTGSVNGADGELYRPAENILKSGDLIFSMNGEAIRDKKELIEKITDSSDDTVTLKVRRGEEFVDVTVNPAESIEDHERKIGVWVRDSTQGIGTLTYYNPDSKAFGALGHGILDVDTKKLMSVKNGMLLKSDIVSIKKGKKGNPGELVGDIRPNDVLGEIKVNTSQGIYGLVNQGTDNLPEDSVPIGLQSDIHEGPARIISNINGSETKSYDVYIESINRLSAEDSKGLVLKITDKELLTKTNGIVQGMSGSPIIQDEKLIGAVTHVFVQNPTKGYGIFIENMMKQEEKI